MEKIKHILCPVDFSDGAEHALQTALKLAETFGAKVEVLHVLETPAYSVHALPPVIEGLERYAQGELDKLLARHKSGKVEIHGRRVEGTPYMAIARAAKEDGIDLIVMGTSGRSGVARALLGAVAERVVRSAPCPVLTVPPK